MEQLTAAAQQTSCTLYRGDCLEIMPTLEAKSVDLCFADLPYGKLDWKSWDVKIDAQKLWNSLHRLQAVSCPILFTANIRFAAHMMMSNIKEFRYDIVWQKHLASNFFDSKKRVLCVHEHILVFGKAKDRYNPQMRDDALRVNVRGKAWTAKEKSVRWHSSAYTSRTTANGKLYPVSVYATNESRLHNCHPTQKPVALLEWLIRTYTNEGDTILDPVFGSNTTGVACSRLGRNYIGIEKDAEYFRIGTERVNAERAALGLPLAQVVL